MKTYLNLHFVVSQSLNSFKKFKIVHFLIVCVKNVNCCYLTVVFYETALCWQKVHSWMDSFCLVCCLITCDCKCFCMKFLWAQGYILAIMLKYPEVRIWNMTPFARTWHRHTVSVKCVCFLQHLQQNTHTAVDNDLKLLKIDF